MTFEDPASSFFVRQDSALSNNGSINDQVERKDFSYHLKEYNSFYAPALAHLLFALICVIFGLIYDQIAKPSKLLMVPFIIFGAIIFLFPFLFTLQRKLEVKTWNSRSLCPCFRDQQEEMLLLGSSANFDDDSLHYQQQPSRLYEKVFKYLLFNDTTHGFEEETIDTPPPSFFAFTTFFAYLFCAFAIVTGWRFEHVNALALFIPMYVLLGVTIAFFWKRGVIFAFLAIAFVISAILSHLTMVSESHRFSVLAIAAPLLIFPLGAFVGSIFTFIYTNSKCLGFTSVFFSLLFTTWVLACLAYLHNYLHPLSRFDFLSHLPFSVVMIPAYLLLCVSFLTLYIKLAQ